MIKKHFTVIEYNRPLPVNLGPPCNTAYGHLPDGGHHGKCYLIDAQDNTVRCMTTYDTNIRHGSSIHWYPWGQQMKVTWYTQGLEITKEASQA